MSCGAYSRNPYGENLLQLWANRAACAGASLCTDLQQVLGDDLQTELCVLLVRSVTCRPHQGGRERSALNRWSTLSNLPACHLFGCTHPSLPARPAGLPLDPAACPTESCPRAQDAGGALQMLPPAAAGWGRLGLWGHGRRTEYRPADESLCDDPE